MKYNLYMLISLVCLLAACSRDEQTGSPEGGKLVVSLNLPGSTGNTYGVAPANGESNVGNVYLLFYPQGAASNVAPAAFYGEAGLTAVGGWTKSFDLSALGLSRDIVYDVYALANLPARTPPPTAGTTKAQLFALTEIQQVRPLDDPQLSFSATATYSGEDALVIGLKRIVARLNLEVVTAGLTATWTVDKVDMLNERKQTAYVEGQPSGSTERTSGEMLPDGGTHTYRYYVYENKPGGSDEMLIVRVALTDASGQHVVVNGLLNQPNGGEIKRNCIYTARMSIKSPFEANAEVEISAFPWDEQVDEAQNGVLYMKEANSYIMKPGTTIEIPVSQANRLVTGAITPTDALTTEMLWVDRLGGGRSMGASSVLAGQPTLAGTGATALVRVTSGSLPGNALIVVKKNNVIVCSWHIWVLDIGMEQYVVTGGNLMMMTLNLGATAADGSANAYGMYYQFGRKDPFPPGNYYGSANNAITKPISATLLRSPQEVIKSPTTFYTNGSIWLIGLPLDTWSASGNKSVWDPCPYGWRLPSKYTFQHFQAGLQKVTDNGVDAFSHPLFGTFPWASHYEGNFVRGGGEPLKLQTVESLTNDKGHLFLMNDGTPPVYKIEAKPQAWAVPVRCTKDLNAR